MNQAALARDHQSIWGAGDELSVLSFNLNGETFAIEATVVQEILDLLPETHVPGSKPFVSSVINFRGKVIPLADIRLAFGMEVSEAKRLRALEDENARLKKLLADQLLDNEVLKTALAK